MVIVPRTRWVVILATLAILLAVFLPEVFAAGWHLIHGKTARYRDWEIPVPGGWFALDHGEQLLVEKMHRFSLWQPQPVVIFQPVHVLPRYVFDYQVWQAEQSKILSRMGYQFSAARMLHVAGQPAACWEFTNIANAAKLWITCVSPTERLSADFMGDRVYAREFYSTVEQLTRRQPHR